MKYRRFGRTNINVSEIGHGLWGMGGWSGSNDRQSLETLQKSLELGCNFYDSAWAYGNGHSDTLLGELIRSNPSAEIITASKVPPKNGRWPTSRSHTLDEVFPRQHVFEHTEKILGALGKDSIDVLQFHVWDDSWTDNDEWKQTVADLKAKKLVRFFGLSLNRWEPWNGLKAIQTGLVDAVQVIYNIFDQAPEDELFPLCEKLGVAVIARVPLDEGGLSGTLTKSTQFPSSDWRARYFSPENLHNTVERADALKKLLPSGMSLPEMSLRFILSHQSVSTCIVGMRTLDHVLDDIRTADGTGLPDELISRLREHRWDRQPAPWSD